jgi:hypothetical protein
MIKKYHLRFLGVREGKEVFKARMSQLGVPDEKVEELVSRAPVVIKRNLTLREARQYADAVQEAGGRVVIQEHGYFEELRGVNHPASITPFRDFTMCPECGLVQPKKQACVKCGASLKKEGNRPEHEKGSA